jgi:hypothetical protein
MQERNLSVQLSSELILSGIEDPELVRLLLSHVPDRQITEYIVENALLQEPKGREYISILLKQAPFLRVDRDLLHQITKKSIMSRETISLVFERTQMSRR